MKYLPLVWAGIWRKRSRAILMLLQIASAFLLFGLLQGLNSGIKQAIANAHADRLYINSSVGFQDPLPMGMLPRIQSILGVLKVSPRTFFAGTYQKPDQIVPIVPADPDTYFSVYGEIQVPGAQLEALKRNRTGAIVGTLTMKEYGWKIGDHVVLQSALPKTDGSHQWAFDIVGVYDIPDQPTNATLLICRFDYFNEARLTGRDLANMFVALIDNPSHAARIGLAIDNAFANSSHETRTQAEGDLIASQLQRVADLDFIIHGIIGAVFFAMLLAVGALMMQSIRERTPELAVLKTVGFSDRLVMWLILAESITFCVFSAAIGLALAALVLPMAKKMIGITSMPAIVIVSGLGFAILLALIGGSVPSRRALKLQVADALADR
ncbi:MAG: ABC transporter permease [Gammaproteobacteria bacterium]